MDKATGRVMTAKEEKPAFTNWHDRPETREQMGTNSDYLDGDSFVRPADKFISLANQRNKKVAATDLQLVMMFAAARYAAHDGKNVLAVDEQEKFIDHMTKQYQDMLRTHMADPTV